MLRPGRSTSLSLAIAIAIVGVDGFAFHETALAEKVPLEEAIQSLEPHDVWQGFYDVTQVPRCSHHEEKIRAFLVQFGNGRGLETIVDEAGNVLIRKPPAAGMENRKGVILQAHMDMVAKVSPGTTHNFDTDPIVAYVEDDWVKAEGTTLGADDGIGIALAMAVLRSGTLTAGPLEALFTVDEEDGMQGALGLKPGILAGDILINLDGEVEGEFTNGSAGGELGYVRGTFDETGVPRGMVAYRVSVQGLKGGHSGLYINQGQGNAAKLLVRFLSVDTSIDDVGAMLSSVWELVGGEVQFSGRYPGWKPNPDSPIVHLMSDVYRELFGVEASVVAIHAGLECGTIYGTYPNLDMISIGPTMQEVHSTNEKMFVPSVKKVMDLLVETLSRIPVK